jgi:hypothetical protein
MEFRAPFGMDYLYLGTMAGHPATAHIRATGKELAFNRGATWVEMLPIGAPIELK